MRFNPKGLIAFAAIIVVALTLGAPLAVGLLLAWWWLPGSAAAVINLIRRRDPRIPNRL